jgi:hypothetical protein
MHTALCAGMSGAGMDGRADQWPARQNLRAMTAHMDVMSM